MYVCEFVSKSVSVCLIKSRGSCWRYSITEVMERVRMVNGNEKDERVGYIEGLDI